MAWVLALAAGNAAVAEQAVQVPGTDIAFSLPESWTEAPAAGKLYAAEDKADKCDLSVMGIANTNGVPVDDASFINGMKNGMAEKAKSLGLRFDVAKEDLMTIGGVPFYHIQAVYNAGSAQAIFCQFYVTGANGMFYLFILRSTQTSMDGPLEAIANSVTFTKPPVVPHRVAPGAQWDFIAYRLGEIAGIALILAIVASFFARMVGWAGRGR